MPMNATLAVNSSTCLVTGLLLADAGEWATVLKAYLVTFGWAIVGSVAMGLGIVIAIKLFDAATRDVDEWQLVREGNLAMAIILAAVVISVGIVIAAAIQP